ncbi:MAG: prolyl oligopeptidase family serine peptidase [Verrucomicrobiota bacterium]
MKTKILISKLMSILLISGLSFVSAGAAAPKALVPKFQPNPHKLNPPPGVVVPPEVRAELTAGVASLGKLIEALPVALRNKPELLALLPDVQIFHNAVRYALEDDIFNSTDQFNSARILLQQGTERARQLAAGLAPWNTKAGLLALKIPTEAAAAEVARRKKTTPAPVTHITVVRGYVSRIDGSVQPYGLRVPVTYLAGGDQPRRLDIWLHGRGDTLNEMAFIEGQMRGISAFLPDAAFVLEPYGRFMNAFKFAGETDVWEGLENVTKHYPIDRNRLAMRGFSMGGAGAWHLGAHHPDQFAAVNPGAGFVDVKNYQKLGDKLDTVPWWEQKLWNLYDPLACPINFVNTTLVAYSGEIDAQKAAADLMGAALLKEGVKMTHIIGPKTGHAYEPEAKKVVAKLVDEAVNQGINHQPKQVTLVTSTLKFNSAHWVTIDALEKHWEPARVEAELTAEGISVKVGNVAGITLALEPDGFRNSRPRITIDNQKLDGPAVVPGAKWSARLVKANGQWSLAAASEIGNRKSEIAKRHNLQGPIDDAFTDSFVMVRPTGEPLNAAVGQWAKTGLAEAVFHWRRFFRGEPRVKDDSAITDEDIKNRNLILWGDPSSNRLLARIADRLPVKWSAKEIKVGDQSYDATKNVPAFIFPNPLNPSRYVVINSGFTFPQYAGLSNAQQTPKLPDWAILDLGVPLADRVGGKGVVTANFFGEQWDVMIK